MLFELFFNLCFSLDCNIFSHQYICTSPKEVLSGPSINLGGFIEPSPPKMCIKISGFCVYVFLWKKCIGAFIGFTLTFIDNLET